MNNELIKKNLAVKIFIPVLIVLVIAGIWVFKKSQNDNLQNDVNPDFALNTSQALDLEKLKSYKLPILIEFGSDSCPACREMAPIIKALNKELQGKAIIKYVDIWKYPAFADGYPLTVIPTQLFINSEGNPYKPENPDSYDFKYYSTKDTNEHVFTTHEGIISKNKLLEILKEMGMQE